MSGRDGDYLRYLKALLNHVDQAMAAEGVEPDVRDRVISRVLHGTPAPGDEEPAERAVFGPAVNTSSAR